MRERSTRGNKISGMVGSSKKSWVHLGNWATPMLFLGATGATWTPCLSADEHSSTKSATPVSSQKMPQKSKLPSKVDSPNSLSQTSLPASLAPVSDASSKSLSAGGRASSKAFSKASLAKADPSRAPYSYYGQVNFPVQWGKYKDLGTSPKVKDRLGSSALCFQGGLLFGNLYTTQDLSLSLEFQALPTWKVGEESFGKRFAFPNHYAGGQLRYGKAILVGLGYVGCSAWGLKKTENGKVSDSGVYLPGVTLSGSYAFMPEASAFASFLYGIPKELDDSTSPNKCALAPHLSVGARGALVKGIQGTLRGFWFFSSGDKTSIKLPTDYAQGDFGNPVGVEGSVVVKLLSCFHLKPFIGWQAVRGIRNSQDSSASRTVYGGISFDLSFSEKTANELDFSSLKNALGFDLKARGSVHEAYPLSPISERWAISVTSPTGNSSSSQTTISLANLYSPNALNTRLEETLTIPDLSKGGYTDGDLLLQLRYSLNEANGKIMKVQLVSKADSSKTVSLGGSPEGSFHQWTYLSSNLPPAGEYLLTAEVDTAASGYTDLSSQPFWSAPQLLIRSELLDASQRSGKEYTVKHYFPGNELIKKNTAADQLISVISDPSTDPSASALAAKSYGDLGYNNFTATVSWIGKAILDCSKCSAQDVVRSLAVYADKMVNEGLDKSDLTGKGKVYLGLTASDDKKRLRVDCFGATSELTSLQALDWVFELNDAKASVTGKLDSSTATPSQPKTYASASVVDEFLTPLTGKKLEFSAVGPIALELDDGSGKKETKLLKLTPEGRNTVLKSLLASEDKASNVGVVTPDGSVSATITELKLPKLNAGQSFTAGLLFDATGAITIKEDKLANSTALATSKALKPYLVYAKDIDVVSAYTLDAACVEGERGQPLGSVTGWTVSWCTPEETAAVLTTVLDDYDTSNKTYSGLITGKLKDQDVTEKMKRNFTQLAGSIDGTADVKERVLKFLALGDYQPASGSVENNLLQVGEYGTLGKANAASRTNNTPVWVKLAAPSSSQEDKEGAFAFLKLTKS